MQLRDGIISTAQSLGIDPVDLATAISYETAGTFDPTKAGPTTQWGQHRGLIQFGEPQAKRYGVDWNDPIGSQLGPNGAVANYLKDTGVKSGMGLLDIYSAINAGGVGLYGRSDANNGGAPGTVADKVNSQMAGHRKKAIDLVGAQSVAADTMTALGKSPETQGRTMTPFISTRNTPEQPQGLLGGYLTPDRRDRMILALEGMTLNPNQGLMHAASQGLSERADGRKEAKAEQAAGEIRNRTAEWLASQGREDLAQAVASGAIDGKSAVNAALKPSADDRTAQIKNYEYWIAQGKSPDEASQLARGGQTINVNNGDSGPQIGTIPQGFQLNLDSETGAYRMEPIPGGPEDIKAQQSAEKEGKAADQSSTQADTVLETIGEIRDLTKKGGVFDLPETGIVGDALAKAGVSQDAVDVRNKLAALESTISFDRLQRMREASPTGGALGAVSERELALLSADMGSLAQSSSPEQFEKVLSRVEKRYTEIKRKFDAYPGQGGAPESKPENNRLRWNTETGDFE